MEDIYSLGFDKSLNRPTINGGLIVYDTFDQTQGASIDLSGGLFSGSNNTVFVVDPKKGIWLGNVNYASAPFRVNMQGDMSATSGAIGGFQIGSNYIKDNADTFGLSSAASSPFDARFWAGDTFANRLIAPFVVFGTTGRIWIQGAAGSSRSIGATSIVSGSPVSRSAIIMANSTAESGTNAGSDFQIQVNDDSGTPSFWPITIERKTGNVVFSAFGTVLPHAKSLVEFQSTTKGVRFPNMTETQRDAITPGAGTVIFNTTTLVLNVFNGSAWITT